MAWWCCFCFVLCVFVVGVRCRFWWQCSGLDARSGGCGGTVATGISLVAAGGRDARCVVDDESRSVGGGSRSSFKL